MASWFVGLPELERADVVTPEDWDPSWETFPPRPDTWEILLTFREPRQRVAVPVLIEFLAKTAREGVVSAVLAHARGALAGQGGPSPQDAQ